MNTSAFYKRPIWMRAVGVGLLALAAAGFALTSGCSSHSTGNGVNNGTGGNNGNNGNNGGNAAPTVVFTPVGGPVKSGDTTTLQWASTGAQSCTASETDPGGNAVTGSGAFTGSQPVSGTFPTQPLTQTGAYTFTLTCVAANGSQTVNNFTVPVVSSSTPTSQPPTFNNFGASPGTVAPGGTTTLNWDVAGATGCTASESAPAGTPATFTGAQPVTGSTQVTLGQEGTYVFTLSCVAADGSQTISNLTVQAAPPPPTITSFSAAPSAVAPGGTTTLTWNTTGAQSCTAGEADPDGNPVTGAGAFNGTQPTHGSFTTQALSSTGAYTFTLKCNSSSNGADNAATTSIANLPVPVTTAAGNFSSLTANPSAIQYTSSPQDFVSTLTWDHSEAASCQAATTFQAVDANGNPTGSPQALTGPGSFTGSQPTVSPAGGFKTPAQNQSGVYTYALTCINSVSGQPEAADTATVTVTNPDVALTVVPNTVQVGGTVTLAWNHPSASACTATETDPKGVAQTDFNGSQAPVNGNHKTAALTEPGIYTFKLACTVGNTTNAIQDAQTVTVLDNVGVGTGQPDGNCDAASNAQVMANTAAGQAVFQAHPGTSGICLLCSVSNPGNAVDPDLSNFATILTTVSLLGGTNSGGAESLLLVNTQGAANASGAYPAGKLAGVVVQTPSQILGAGVLQSITVSTLKYVGPFDNPTANTLQPTGESASIAQTNQGAVKLQLLGLTGNGTLSYLAFQTKGPFDAIEVRMAGLANVNNHLDVAYGCVADPAVQ